MDWNQARAFCLTADNGSLSAAARELGLTQPTLSRQVGALEAAMGVSLFERVGKRLVLTDSGRALAPIARQMYHAAKAMELAAAGQSSAMEGIVTLSASDSMAVHFLPDILVKIRDKAPGIALEILVANDLSDLLRREADIAIRHVRPHEPELIAQSIGEASAHFYASKEWVRKNGNPADASQSEHVPFIGFDTEMQFNSYLNDMGLQVQEENINFFCENSVMTHELLKRGAGVGVLMTKVGDASPNLVRVFNKVEEIKFPIWLVTHRELRTSKRIRFVNDMLAEGLRELKL